MVRSKHAAVHSVDIGTSFSRVRVENPAVKTSGSLKNSPNSSVSQILPVTACLSYESSWKALWPRVKPGSQQVAHGRVQMPHRRQLLHSGWFSQYPHQIQPASEQQQGAPLALRGAMVLTHHPLLADPCWPRLQLIADYVNMAKHCCPM